MKFLMNYDFWLYMLFFGSLFTVLVMKGFIDFSETNNNKLV